MNLISIAVVWTLLSVHPHLNAEAVRHQGGNGHNPGGEIATLFPPIVVQADPPTSANRAEEHYGRSQPVQIVSMPDRGLVDYILLGINFILAISACTGVVAAFKTLAVIKRQTKATENSVEETKKAVIASERSVEAQARAMRSFINTERPFIVVEVSGDVDNLTITAANKGRTPARILFINPLLQWNYIPYLETLPSEPDYSEAGVSIENIERFNLDWILPGTPGYRFPTFNARSLIEGEPALAASVKNFLTSFYVYSTIRYTGIISEEDVYETRFCYKLSLDKFILSGPYGYNKST